MSTEPAPDCRCVLLGNAARPARLIVCERMGRWAVVLRRELAGSDLRVYETRSLVECWKELAESPAGLAVVELTAGSIAPLLQRLARLHSDLPLARVAVVADRSLVKYEWLIREAGAVHFTCSSRQLGPLARVAGGHLDRAPSPPKTLVEKVWDRLPW